MAHARDSARVICAIIYARASALRCHMRCALARESAIYTRAPAARAQARARAMRQARARRRAKSQRQDKDIMICAKRGKDAREERARAIMIYAGARMPARQDAGKAPAFATSATCRDSV